MEPTGPIGPSSPGTPGTPGGPGGPRGPGGPVGPGGQLPPCRRRRDEMRSDLRFFFSVRSRILGL